MNLEVIQFLLDNINYLEEQANESKVDVDPSIGIAKKLIGNAGNIEELSKKQKYHYDKVIAPLIENVDCHGVVGMIETEDGKWVDTCSSNGIIDDESLLVSYLEEDFKCQICRFDREKMD